MKTESFPPGSPALLTEGPPVFQIVMLYEDAESGRRAKRFCDTWMMELREQFECHRNLWSFDVLGIPTVRNAAASSAAAANVVIFSASGERHLSAIVEHWLEMWAWLIDRSRPALFALIHNPDGTSARKISNGLRALAESKDLEFSQVPTLCAMDANAFQTPADHSLAKPIQPAPGQSCLAPAWRQRPGFA